MSSEKSTISKVDSFFFWGIIAVLVLLATPLFMAMHAQDVVRVERAEAWTAAVQAAPSQEEQLVLRFVRSKVEGCRDFTGANAAQGTIPYGIDLKKMQQLERRKRLAHEQACLERLRGEVLVGMPVGRRMILDVGIPL